MDMMKFILETDVYRSRADGELSATPFDSRCERIGRAGKPLAARYMALRTEIAQLWVKPKKAAKKEEPKAESKDEKKG